MPRKDGMARSKHPDKDLEALLRSLESSGWRIEKGQKYFKGYCPYRDHKWVDVCTTVEGDDEASALRAGLVAVRSAAYHAGAATPGGEADLDKVRATIQPSELVAPS